MQGNGAEAYVRAFPIAPLPRAWAIASNGAYGGAWGGKSADKVRDDALAACQRRGGGDCALYARDLDVVWQGRAPEARAVPGALAEAPGFAIIPDPRFFWHGPKVAKGLFVWGHGFKDSRTDRRGIQPPAFLRAFNNAGWDIARYDRAASYDARVDLVAQWLHTALVGLRGQGWARIAAGGQSRGGWNALEMLRYPGTADVVITTSAGPGTGTNPAKQATKGQGMLRDLTEEVPPQSTRLAYAQFAEDPYGGDKNQRARQINQTLPQKLGAVLLIDQPAGFKGHGAGEGFAFAERYGACLLRFAEDTPPGHC